MAYMEKELLDIIKEQARQYTELLLTLKFFASTSCESHSEMATLVENVGEDVSGLRRNIEEFRASIDRLRWSIIALATTIAVGSIGAISQLIGIIQKLSGN